MARFDNARDANQYLAQTVNLWDGNPIYIERVNDAWMARGYELPIRNGSNQVEWDIRDPRFNCFDFRLGYMNTQHGASFYCSRVPNRGVAQGLSDNNLMFTGHIDDPEFGRMGMHLAAALREQGFVDMLKGQYPNRAEVEKSLSNPKTRSVAVSRVLAIKRHHKLKNLHYLEYKGEEIAFSETIEFQLPREFEYLREIAAPTGFCKRA